MLILDGILQVRRGLQLAQTRKRRKRGSMNDERRYRNR